jgi:hypothetical protein
MTDDPPIPTHGPDGKKLSKQQRSKFEHHAMLVRVGDILGADRYAKRANLRVDLINVPLVNGWPVTAEAEITRRCRNPRLCAITLPDGREASAWQTRYAIGARVRVKLESSGGDPIYEIVGTAGEPVQRRLASEEVQSSSPVEDDAEVV